MNQDSRTQLLAEIASMYYLEKRSQEEIAKEFGYSRSAISRLLSEAEEKGIVEYKINFPSVRNVDLENQMKERFGLRDVVVVNRNKMSYPQALKQVGIQGAEVFKKLLKDDQVISIATGTSIFGVVDALEECNCKNIRVVQILGSTGVKSDPSIDGPELAALLAKKLKGQYFTLNSPMLMDNKASRDTILRQKSIRGTIDLAYETDVVLAGIGGISEGPYASSVVRMGYLEPYEYDDLRTQGTVGYICGWFFNEDGAILDDQINDRVVAADIRKIRRGDALIVVVAAGSIKAQAIRAAIKGRLLDILITDSEAAESILQIQD